VVAVEQVVVLLLVQAATAVAVLVEHSVALELLAQLIAAVAAVAELMGLTMVALAVLVLLSFDTQYKERL
jgi:hypothetical protein